MYFVQNQIVALSCNAPRCNEDKTHKSDNRGIIVMKTDDNRHDRRTLEESYLLQKANNEVLRKNNELLEENNRLLKDIDSKLRKIAINTS